MFAEQVKQEDMRAVFLEYAWDMGWCDPCAADPLSADELRSSACSGSTARPRARGHAGGGASRRSRRTCS